LESEIETLTCRSRIVFVLHSFPTRRSSDLVPRRRRQPASLDPVRRQRARPARENRGIRRRDPEAVRRGRRRADRRTRRRRGKARSEEHTSELQSREKLVCRVLLEKKE